MQGLRPSFSYQSALSSKKTKFFCPFCHHALFVWKVRPEVTIHKCGNDACPHRIQNLNKLNAAERHLRKKRSSQFKLCYQYREYFFEPRRLAHSAPLKPKVDITRIHNSNNILGLILTFYVSFALSARKAALIMRSVFNVPVSYQTVLNYAEAASYYCHQFNLDHKGDIDDLSAGDETYIKIQGEHAFTFLFISCKNHKITAYHVADTRGTVPAIAAVNEAVRTARQNQSIGIVTDDNPAYAAAVLYLNAQPNKPVSISQHKVIGLQNLDEQSALFRPFKQIIERLNRTYKQHVRPSHGFNSSNGAVALTTLFVTHYNFLRPHMALNYKTPVHLPALDSIATIQGKWSKIISLALC